MTASSPAEKPSRHPASPAECPKSDPSGEATLKICIASPELAGLTKRSDIGTAYAAMAQTLAAARHEVTCLFIGSRELSASAWQHCVEKYKSDGIALIALPSITASELVAPVNLIRSYETYQWLKRNDRFDIIHFPEQQGAGYHTLTAKHHGLAFVNTTICVGPHSMNAWLMTARKGNPDDLADVDTSFMERRVVAMADAVVNPSRHLASWISEHHREMPRQRSLQQPTPCNPLLAAVSPAAPSLLEIDELVYFGPLESPKGVTLFCDALDCIPSNIAAKIKKVAFLGRESIIDGIPSLNYLQKRAQNWPFALETITGSVQSGTMNYLRQVNRLTVIPSLFESSPYRILECLVAGVAFVASSVGGISDLIAPADVGRVCFEPTVGALCAALCTTLTEGYRPARALPDSATSAKAWVVLHENSCLTPLLRRAVLPPIFARDPSARNNPPNEATQAAIHALSMDPANTVALKALARIYLNARLPETAQEACQLILKRDADDAEALQMIDEAIGLEKGLSEKIFAPPQDDPAAREFPGMALFQSPDITVAQMACP